MEECSLHMRSTPSAHADSPTVNILAAYWLPTTNLLYRRRLLHDHQSPLHTLTMTLTAYPTQWSNFSLYRDSPTTNFLLCTVNLRRPALLLVSGATSETALSSQYKERKCQMKCVRRGIRRNTYALLSPKECNWFFLKWDFTLRSRVFSLNFVVSFFNLETNIMICLFSLVFF
jgi:hypothetical protein